MVLGGVSESSSKSVFAEDCVSWNGSRWVGGDWLFLQLLSTQADMFVFTRYALFNLLTPDYDI